MGAAVNVTSPESVQSMVDAVLAFSKNLSREISAEGITINSVCPGETQEVANAILFLASKEASYITGEEIDINGGSHMD